MRKFYDSLVNKHPLQICFEWHVLNRRKRIPVPLTIDIYTISNGFINCNTTQYRYPVSCKPIHVGT